jgi:hypothetical protein
MDGRGIKRIIAEQREEVEFLLNSGPVIERELSIDRAFAHPNAVPDKTLNFKTHKREELEK